MLLDKVRKDTSDLPKLILLDEVDQPFDIIVKRKILILLLKLSLYGKIIVISDNENLINTKGCYWLDDKTFTFEKNVDSILKKYNI